MAREEHITVMEANNLDQSAASNNNEPLAVTRRLSSDDVRLIPEEGCAKAALPLQQIDRDEIKAKNKTFRRFRSSGRPVLGAGGITVLSYIMMVIIFALLHQTSEAASTDTDHVSRRVQNTPSFVCSPMTYNFTLNLSRNCGTNTINDNPGISNTVCSLLNADDIDTSSLNVYEVGFVESELSTSSVINQDIRSVDLVDGDTISFDSVSKQLNVDEPLSEQLESIPEAVILTIKARSEDGTIVTNRVAWTFSYAEESLPVSVGDAIAWITLTDVIPADPSFCMLPTSSPTSSPTKTSDAPTSLPTNNPTQAPIAAPVAVTDSPTTSSTMNRPSPNSSMSMSTSTFSKAAKLKRSKTSSKGGKSSLSLSL